MKTLLLTIPLLIATSASAATFQPRDPISYDCHGAVAANDDQGARAKNSYREWKGFCNFRGQQLWITVEQPFDDRDKPALRDTDADITAHPYMWTYQVYTGNRYQGTDMTFNAYSPHSTNQTYTFIWVVTLDNVKPNNFNMEPNQ